MTLAGEGTRMLPVEPGGAQGVPSALRPGPERGARPETGRPLGGGVPHRGGRRPRDGRRPTADRAFVQYYFTVDPEFLERHRPPRRPAGETRRFYGRSTSSGSCTPRSRAPPDSATRSSGRRRSIGENPFLLHPGDGIVVEPQRGAALRAMAELREREKLDAVVLAQGRGRPASIRGPRGSGRPESGPVSADRCHPNNREARASQDPLGRRGGLCVWTPSLPRPGGRSKGTPLPELELTDGIQRIIEQGGRVASLLLGPRTGTWRSVGSPEGYGRALEATRRVARPASAGAGERLRPFRR